VKRSLRSWLWRIPVPQEIDEELALHVEMRTKELVDRGVDPITARVMATAKMGDLAAVKRTCLDLGGKRDREMRMALWLEELKDDVTFALRQLRRAPAFTVVAVVTLALGIGANSAIFALVDATLLRPLPYRDPARLVSIWESSASTTKGFASPPNMLDWNARSRTFEMIAGFAPNVGTQCGRHGNGWRRRKCRDGFAPLGDRRNLRRARRAADCGSHIPAVGR
jgi:putative ABC transport system permease protein